MAFIDPAGGSLTELNINKLTSNQCWLIKDS